jgi:predicted amidohydrolase YtcJ
MPADLALVDVAIRTLDPANPIASAIAVQDGVIVAVGDPTDIRDVCDATTRVVSGLGWHVTPGLTDGHQHLLMGAQLGRGISFDRVASLDEVRRLLREERERVGPDGWVRGWAFEYAALGGLAYDHELLDEAAGPGPMFFISLDVHTGFANGEALRRAGITGTRQFPDGSIVVVDDSGRPTGELREMTAMQLVLAEIPEPSEDEVTSWYVETMHAQNAVGLTGVHNMDGDRSTLETYAALEAAGLLTLRIRQHNWVGPADGADVLADIASRRDLRGRLWTANSLKFMIDGVIDTGTAWMEEPDSHGDGRDPMWPDIEHYRRTIKRFHDAGFYITTHAIGDRAVREVLDAYAAAGGSNGRHRIEHIEAPSPESQVRFAREGVNASMQPVHLRWLNPDMSDPWSERLGVHKCAHTMPSGDIATMGANVVLGSDWPVAPYDPRFGFFAAQMRRAHDVEDPRPLGTSRAFDGLETLEGYTVNAAKVDGGDGGVLRVGAPADFVAWGDDIASVAPADVIELPVHLTVVDGQIVHQAD